MSRGWKIGLGITVAGFIALGFWGWHEYKLFEEGFNFSYRSKRINSLGLRNVNVTLVFDVINPFTFDVMVTDQTYYARINNKTIATIYNRVPVLMNKRVTTPVAANIQADPSKALGTTFQEAIKTLGNTKFVINGRVWAQPQFFPFTTLNISIPIRIPDAVWTKDDLLKAIRA